MDSTATAIDRIHDRIVAIEQALDSGQYRPGPWESMVRIVRALPIADRALLAGDLSRVSRKLHQRHHWRTVSVNVALALEIVLAIIGGILLVLGLQYGSDLLVIAAAALWSVAFQPLIKVTTGLLLGLGYDYAYLYYVEPRFKMTYGEYLAAPRWARIKLHCAGMIGSPLGLWLPTVWASNNLLAAINICRAFFWLIVLINAGSFFAALCGIRKIAGFRLRLIDSSGGMAALELREALEI
ncbi:MAG TPA: hypothetical protein VMU41_11095 [Candidatus Binataceae bacterium]|nr:hypothetical protein [Candidatus Binataceae bacterium]